VADVQTLLKAAMDMYQAQYIATDKLWGYFSVVSLAVVAYTISSEKVTRIFPEAFAVLTAYVVFCFGNFAALEASQRQLVALADLLRERGKAAGVNVEAFNSFEPRYLMLYYVSVVLAICFATTLLAWYRGRNAVNA
jgi:hypothetical protein